MKRFRYKAYDQAGTVKQGEMEGVSLDSVKFKLKESGYIPVFVTDAADKPASVVDRLRNHVKPGLEEIEELTSRLAILLKNGIKVDHAFEYARKGVVNHRLKTALEHIHGSIRKGTALSDVLNSYPDVFDPLYVNLVKVGEQSGNLARSFSDIADALAFRKYILSKTRQALIYPLIIVLVCTGSIIFMFNFVVPRFASVFSGGMDIPVYTRLLLDASRLFQQYQLLLLILVLFLAAGLYALKDHPKMKSISNAVFAGTPLLKDLTFIRENLRFASTLSMLLSSGVLLSDALEHAVASVSNIRIRAKLSFVKKRVRQGETLSDVLTDAGLLPEMFEGLVQVGEQTGNLAEVFKEVEGRLKTDYENRINTLLTMIEPLMIVIMGLIVGSVVVGLLMSMVSVNDMVF